MTRAISASRQRTGSRSPRRASVVMSMPTRSSTSPKSNRPENGSDMGQRLFRKSRYQEIIVSPNTNVTAEAIAKNTPNGSS